MTGFDDDPWLAVITTQTDRLLETIRGFDDDAVRQPSLCPGWTRGHVLTHIARNADGLGNVLRVASAQVGAVADGAAVEGAMYESQESRDREIEAGAGRSAAELESDVEVTADELLAALADTPDEAMELRVPRLRSVAAGSSQTLMPVRKVPPMRLKEVVFHHLDLDAGYTLDDAPPGFVVAELADSARRFTLEPAFVLDAGEAGRWDYGTASRGASGDEVTVQGTPADLLGWIIGRTDGSALSSNTGTLPLLPAWG